MMKHRFKWLFTIAGLILLGIIAVQYVRYRLGAGHIVGRLSNDIITTMTQDMKKGHTDKVIEEGQLALKNDPKNTSLLESLAIACLVQAQKKPAEQSEEWIRKSASYANDLAKNTSKQNLGTIVYVLQAGKILETAGDLSTTKCVYYKQANDVLENQGPVVKESDTVTLYGKTFPLASAFHEKIKTLAEVCKKLADAHCDQ